MSLALKSFWSNLPRTKRSSLLLLAALVLAIGLVKAGRSLYLRYVESHWETIAEEKTRGILEGIRSSFDRIQERTRLVASQVAGDTVLRRALDDPTSPRARLFERLQRFSRGQEVSLELYNRDMELLAWLGREVGPDLSEIRQALRSGAVTSICQSALYTYVTTIEPMRDFDGKVIGAVAAGLPVEVNYPLSNRFLTSSGIEVELSQRFGTGIRFQFGEGIDPTKDGRLASMELVVLDGRKLGMAYVERPQRSSVLQNIDRIADNFVSVLGALAPFVLVLAFCSDLRKLRPWRRTVLIIVLAWAIRYFWIFLDFPSRLMGSGIFEPLLFASPFAWGATRSIGELLITSIFLMSSVLVLFVQFVQLIPKTDFGQSLPAPLRGTIGIGGPLLGCVAFLFLTRGYAEAIRSAVYDSKLQYIDLSSIVLEANLAAMLFAILLLTVAFLLISVILFQSSVHMASRFVLGPVSQALHPVLFASALFLAASFAFGIIHPNPQTSGSYRFILILSVALFSYFLVHEVGRAGGVYTGRTLTAIIILSVLIATPVLDTKIHERDRDTLRAYAVELARPVDTWVRVVLEETLSQMKSDAEALEILKGGDPGLIGGLAFRLWARSTLSKEGLSCAVGIVQNEKVESLFNLGLRRSEATSMIETLEKSREIRIYLIRGEDEIRGLNRYVGTVPIEAEDGQVLAHLVIAIVSGQGFLLRTEMPEILQAASALTLESPYRTIVASEFSGRSMIRTTGKDFVLGRQMPGGIYIALANEKIPYIWVDESADGKEFETVYVLSGREGGKVHIYSLSLEKLDLRWHMFNLLKLVYFYFFVAIVAAGFYVLVIALRRKKFHLSFRGKLLAALLSLAILPLIVLAYYDREFTKESRMEILRHQAEDELSVVESNLVSHLLKGLNREAAGVGVGPEINLLTDSLCEQLAQETGSDFNVYVEKEVRATSRPELFDAGLMDSRLSSEAYRNVLLEGKKFFFQTETVGSFPLLVAYRRLDDYQGRPFGAISVFTGFRHEPVDLELFKRSAFLFGAYAAVMVLVVSIGTFFAYRIGSPIKKLTDAMRRVSRGDLDVSIGVQSKDEIGEMVAAFNKMTQDLKRIQKELAKTERELAWREMAKQVAHEIKNPLTPMKLSIQHLRQAYRDRVADFHLLLERVSTAIEEQVDALTRIASEFSHYAKMPERRYERCDVNELLEETVRLFDQEKRVRFAIELGSECPTVLADKEELRRVFINIVRNAVQAITERGEIAITSKVQDGMLKVVIADTGKGIPDEIKGRLFEPNFSTKTEGMGLGLAISRQTIVDLGGRIEIESEVGKGTRALIFLPLTSSS